MTYPFLMLNDDTEIAHSELQEDGTVKVYVETPDPHGFRSACCILPRYEWQCVRRYSLPEIRYIEEVLRSTAHLIMRFAAEGGFDSADHKNAGETIASTF